mgnify:CR=1
TKVLMLVVTVIARIYGFSPDLTDRECWWWCESVVNRLCDSFG